MIILAEVHPFSLSILALSKNQVNLPELFTSRGCCRYKKAERTGKTGTSGKAVECEILVKSLKSHEILMWLKRH